MNIGELGRFRAGIATDTISEHTSASGVTADGVLLKDSAVTAASGVSTDTITEHTSGSGVTVDGLLLKDAGVENAVKVQFTQQASDPATPSAGESEFYVKTDGKAYLKNPDGVVTPVGGGNTIDRVAQTTHGFAVGNLVRMSGNDTYTKAEATTATGAEVVAMIYRVIDTGNFECTTGGVVDGLAAAAFSEGAIPAAGTVCYLNADAGTGAGLLTTTEPNTVGLINKPCYIVTASGATASGYFFNMRGQVVGGTNAFTNTALSNNAATTIYTITDDAGSGGMIQGTLKIVTSSGTNYTLWCGCSYNRQQDGTTYNVGGAFFDGDIPAGTIFDNSGSALRLTLPNVTNFSSAQFRWMRYG